MTRDIPEGESLMVEFKSDRGRLCDRDLVANVVCLANTDGGELYLGVEDDGTVTGLQPAHRNLTGLTALIANQTSPPLTVRVAAIEIEGQRIARIMVPKSRQLVATSEGLLQRRRLKADGRPECVPFYPHEFARRQSDLGLLGEDPGENHAKRRRVPVPDHRGPGELSPPQVGPGRQVGSGRQGTGSQLSLLLITRKTRSPCF